MCLDLITHLQSIESSESNTVETLATLQRAIKNLSQDLYGSDSHYLYELIQNADDNQYEKSTIPELKIELKEVRLEDQNCVVIIITNNEVGFDEKDVHIVN